MPQRYRIIGLPGTRNKYVILDQVVNGYCTLPLRDKNLLPLEWPSHPRAELWLNRCYSAWREWEAQGRSVPDNWEPYSHIPKASPFSDRRYPAEYNEPGSLRSPFAERRNLGE